MEKITIGTIFESSWGYDQTNVDFYEVIGRTPKTVIVREIAKEHVYAGDLTGTVIPKPGHFKGEVLRRKLMEWGKDHFAFKVNSCANAYLWSGKPSHYTAYA